MNTKETNKTGWIALATLALSLVFAGGASAADTNPLNDSDSFTITLTPGRVIDCRFYRSRRSRK